MKKLAFVLFLILLPDVFLFSGDFSISGMVGWREAVTTTNPLSISLYGRYEDYRLALRMQTDQMEDFSFSWNRDINKYFGNNVLLHWQHVPKEGGFSDVAYSLSFKGSTDIFRLSFSLGIQFGFAYTMLSSSLMYSLSPLVNASLGIAYGPMETYLYMSMSHPDERSWKAIPVVGAYTIGHIDEHNMLVFEGYMKMAEYWVDPITLITGFSFRIGYAYRGAL